ncbi:MAG: hypothetical protein HY303_07220 [Candidatus Wallbacteria bacterium]|nr:hypothetical protein [Candidatus Wallbacteria bacterium]
MDFTKVQRLRDSDRKKRRAWQAAMLFFTIGMGWTFIPKVQQYQLKKTTAISADSFMKYLQAENLRAAYEIGLKPSLKKQHPYPAFDAIFHKLMLRKGGLIDYHVKEFVSHPNGKPYEMLTYELIHDRGLSKLDLALEPEGEHYVIRAYRIIAAGI